MTECQEVSSSGIQEHSEEEQPPPADASMPGAQELGAEPSHHARRPMNAFLIFCKRHRGVVREKHPNLENRSITKILGEWWAHIDKEDKASYTGLAKEYKDAFLSANPDFKWYKLPAPPLRNFAAQRIPHTSTGGIPSDHEGYHSLEMLDAKPEPTNNNHLIKYDYNDKPSTSTFKHASVKQGKKSMFTPGKLADEANMGGLSSLILSHSSKNKEDSYNDPRNQPHSGPRPFSKYHSPSYRSTKCGFPTAQNVDSSLDDVAPNTTATLSDIEKRLQDALTETTRSFEMDKSNDSSTSNEKSISELPHDSKDTSQCYDSDGTYSGGEGASKDRTREYNYLKHQSSLSSDESQDKDFQLESRTKSMWEVDPNLARGSDRACKGKRYQQFIEHVGLRVKRQKKDHTEKNNKQSRGGDPNSPTTHWKPSKMYPKDHPSTVTSDKMEMSTESELPDNDYCMYNVSAYKYSEAGQTSYDYDDNMSDHPETFEGPSCKMFTASDFDLDSKIKALPPLSWEKFQLKKKEMKTRKRNVSSSSKSRDTTKRASHATNKYYPQTYSSSNSKGDQIIEPKGTTHQTIISNEYRTMLAQQRKSEIIGSKKRKLRKASINRIDVNLQQNTNNNDSVNNNVTTKPIHSNNCTKDNIIPSTSVSNPAIVHANNDNLIMNQNAATSDLCALATLAEVAANTSKID